MSGHSLSLGDCNIFNCNCDTSLGWCRQIVEISDYVYRLPGMIRTSQPLHSGKGTHSIHPKIMRQQYSKFRNYLCSFQMLPSDSYLKIQPFHIGCEWSVHPCGFRHGFNQYCCWSSKNRGSDRRRKKRSIPTAVIEAYGRLYSHLLDVPVMENFLGFDLNKEWMG